MLCEVLIHKKFDRRLVGNDWLYKLVLSVC